MLLVVFPEFDAIITGNLNKVLAIQSTTQCDSWRGYAVTCKLEIRIINNGKTVFPYFDFSLNCWNQSIVNGTSANGRLHYAAGA
ncbi:MAG: hypothetical protein IIV41_07090, partial [Akkermansia sp.]|nr:hypothetical protein [Akkermansia sp.]